MKRFTKHLFLALMCTALFAACASEEKKPADQQEETPANVAGDKKGDAAVTNIKVPATLFDNDDACAVAYINVDNLVAKSGITENQRKTLGALAIQDINDEYGQQYVLNTILDLDNSGIKFSKPIYATLNVDMVDYEPVFELIAVAEVSNSTTLDEFVKHSEVETRVNDKGTHYMTTIEDGIYITAGYDKNNLVITATNGGSSHSYDLFVESLNNATINLAPFSNRDVALYFNLEKTYDVFKDTYYAYETAELKQMVAENFNNFKDCKMVAGLTFEKGRIVLDTRTAGFDKIFEQVNVHKASTNANLKYIPYNALAFANLSIDGDKLAELLNRYMTRDVKAMLAEQLGISVNDITAYTTIAGYVIESIDGDITLALNNLNIETVTEYEYDYFYDDYYEYQTEKLTDIEAALIANTDSNYIIENVKAIPSNILPLQERSKGSLYTADIEEHELSIGQTGNTFYVGINNRCENAPRQNMESEWASEFEGSLAYVVFDVQNFMASKMGKNIRQEMQYESEYEIFNKIVNLTDCIWINSKSMNNAELVVSLTDKESNSFEQIVNLLLDIYQNKR